MIDAEIHHEMESEVKKKGKAPKKKKLKDERVTVKISGIIGDGKAEVERGRTIRMATAYSELAVTSTCHIRVTCNQDKATVMATARKAMEIVDDILVEDETFMSDFLRGAQ